MEYRQLICNLVGTIRRTWAVVREVTLGYLPTAQPTVIMDIKSEDDIQLTIQLMMTGGIMGTDWKIDLTLASLRYEALVAEILILSKPTFPE